MSRNFPTDLTHTPALALRDGAMRRGMDDQPLTEGFHQFAAEQWRERDAQGEHVNAAIAVNTRYSELGVRTTTRSELEFRTLTQAGMVLDRNHLSLAFEVGESGMISLVME